MLLTGDFLSSSSPESGRMQFNVIYTIVRKFMRKFTKYNEATCI